MGDFEEDFLFLEFMLCPEHLEDASVGTCFFPEVVTSLLMSQIYSAFSGGLKTLSGDILFPPREISCKISV